MKKGMMFCGKDNNNIVRPISVDENGKINLPFSYETDDNDRLVLRVVDAAPFTVEYGIYSDLTGSEQTVYPEAAKVLDENADRKYVSIYNASSVPILLMTAANASGGIGIAPGERYEMSAPKGGLYLGDLYIKAMDTLSVTSTSFNQGGINNTGINRSSTTRTFATLIPVTVTEAGLAVSVAITSSVASIRNVATFSTNTENSEALVSYTKAITAYFPKQDGTYTNASFVLDNPEVKYLGISFCKTSNTSATLSPSDMSGSSITVKMATASTAYIAEGE